MTAQAQLDDTDMSDPQGQQDPSMEEILASIRRIISEGDDEQEGEQQAAGPASSSAENEDEVLELVEAEEPDDDVLDLTTAIADDGTTAELEEEEPEEDVTIVMREPDPEPEPELEPEPIPEPEPEMLSMPEPEPEPAREPIPDPEPEPVMQNLAPSPPADTGDRLVSNDSEHEARDAFAELAQAVEREEPKPAPVSDPMPLGHSARTLEEMVLESLRPMLKGWLDQNLPDMVERLVKEEIQRLARR